MSDRHPVQIEDKMSKLTNAASFTKITHPKTVFNVVAGIQGPVVVITGFLEG